MSTYKTHFVLNYYTIFLYNLSITISISVKYKEFRYK